MMFIPIVYYIVFRYIPMFGNIIAFRRYRAGSSIFGDEWSGLKYFNQFMKDQNFWRAFKNTLLLNFKYLIISFPLTLIFALLLNEVKNVHFKKSGAFTGEISADMLTEMGVEYVIIGHSERRQYFGETDLTVNRRVKAALAAGLKVILCVGEMLSEREDGITEDVVELQTVAAFTGVSEEDAKNVIIAYEPVWAIGTGKTATAEQANEVCSFIRGVVAKRYNKAVADGMTIQYGGSMNPKNAAELLAQPDVDGGLIGGASLKAADFGVLLEEASK